MLCGHCHDGSVDQLPRLTEELVRLKVDVIVASAAPPALAAKKVTTSVPIVFVGVADPVELGLVRSLGRPGGNSTGLADSGPDLRREAPGAAERARSQAQARRDALAFGESGQSRTARAGGGRSAHARDTA